MLLNYLPVGSEEAARFYAECALEARRRPRELHPRLHRQRPRIRQALPRREGNIPIVGDDIKAQLGATITHRALTDLFPQARRQARADLPAQHRGQHGFPQHAEPNRLASKKESKTEAVQSVAGERIADENIHVGPSDYVPWQNDNKVCFLRMEGKLFGDVPMNHRTPALGGGLAQLGGVSIDAIRCAKLALEPRRGGCAHRRTSCLLHEASRRSSSPTTRPTPVDRGFHRRSTGVSDRVRKCLVIAAGRGSRLASGGLPKPLFRLLGLPLIERAIVTAKRAGLEDFTVVTGYDGEAHPGVSRSHLALRRGVSITHVVNEEWEAGNGISVLKASEAIWRSHPFALLMADHLVSLRLLSGSPLAAPLGEGTASASPSTAT